MADVIARWKVTLVCLAPSFLKGLLSTATKKELKSVRYFVVGAEKAPDILFEKVKKLDTSAILIEGYGITECSPILTINRPEKKHVGVGQPIPEVDVCTIDLETDTLLKKGQEGEICVRGDNVFAGYLGKHKSPFIEINNEKWYRTGDLGYLDKDNNLILSGRLKRFAKIAGEMISLGGIEDVIMKALEQRGVDLGDEAALAVCVKEESIEKPIIILFTTLDLDKNDINMILKSAGFSRLVKIGVIKKIDYIPLMGTGKVDYRYLQRLI